MLSRQNMPYLIDRKIYQYTITWDIPFCLAFYLHSTQGMTLRRQTMNAIYGSDIILFTTNPLITGQNPPFTAYDTLGGGQDFQTHFSLVKTNRVTQVYNVVHRFHRKHHGPPHSGMAFAHDHPILYSVFKLHYFFFPQHFPNFCHSTFYNTTRQLHLSSIPL